MVYTNCLVHLDNVSEPAFLSFLFCHI